MLDAFGCNFVIAPFVSFRVSVSITDIDIKFSPSESAPRVFKSVCVCVYLGNKALRTRPFIILPRTEIKPQIDMGARLLLLPEFTFSGVCLRQREKRAEINWNNSNNLINYHRVLPFLESK